MKNIFLASLLCFSGVWVLAQGSTLKVMPLGNSITQGKNGEGSYREALWRKLDSAGYNVDFVGSEQSLRSGGTSSGSAPANFDPDHEGHWGWRTNEILDGRHSNVDKLSNWLQNYTPDVALVHLGTNDLLKDNQSPAGLVSELESVISTLRADNPNVVIFLAELIPSSDGTLDGRVNNFNPEIVPLAAAQTTSASPVIAVDQNTGYVPADDSFDAYHPNSSGQEKMAQRWFAAMDAYYNPSTFPVEWGELTASAFNASQVRLAWATWSEAQNAGFEVQHRQPPEGRFETIGFVSGTGTTQATQRYEFETGDLSQGRHLFRLAQLDLDGSRRYSRLLEVTLEGVNHDWFQAIYHPATMTLIMHADLEGAKVFRWSIYSGSGQCLKQAENLGNHTKQVNLADLPRGMYYLMAESNDKERIYQKIVLQ